MTSDCRRAATRSGQPELYTQPWTAILNFRNRRFGTVARDIGGLARRRDASKPKMIIALGCDHAGFALKATVAERLGQSARQLLDCGAWDDTPSDYPDFARAVGEAILSGRAERGILICGSGVGASVAANKLPGIRASLCHDTFSARQGVEDDNLNVLCCGARVIGPALTIEVVEAFLAARFSGAERHLRRLAKVDAMERDARAGIFDSLRREHS